MNYITCNYFFYHDIITLILVEIGIVPDKVSWILLDNRSVASLILLSNSLTIQTSLSFLIFYVNIKLLFKFLEGYGKLDVTQNKAIDWKGIMIVNEN